MATTINADTVVGGAIVTGDASGVLALQAAGNTGLTLNSSRAIGVGASPSFGSSGQLLVSAGSGAAPAWTTLNTSPTIVRSARTSNTILGTADASTLIAITSGTFTQTFTAAATLGSGWFCYIQNSGTGVITLDPNSSEQIDGLTSYEMYPGECRLVQCTGTAFFSLVIDPFTATFTSTGTFTKPPGYTQFGVRIFGGGGGGGGGKSAGAGNQRSGGGGGGGGGQNIATILASAVGATETVTIAAGGTGGTGGTSANGNSGGIGGDSSFGSLIFAYGGGQGTGGANSSGGGGGGGSASAANGGDGGRPNLTFLNNAGGGVTRSGTSNQNDLSCPSIGFGGGGALNGAVAGQDGQGGSSEYGGSGGGWVIGNQNTTCPGSRSVFGATGGGPGGSINSSNTPGNGGDGGGVGFSTVNGSSQGGGAAGGAANVSDGTNGSVLSTGAGGGAGGGGSSTVGTGFAGGVGAQPGGGGGGGGGSNTTGGVGGIGGAGICYIWGIT